MLRALPGMNYMCILCLKLYHMYQTHLSEGVLLPARPLGNNMLNTRFDGTHSLTTTLVHMLMLEGRRTCRHFFVLTFSFTTSFYLCTSACTQGWFYQTLKSGSKCEKLESAFWCEKDQLVIHKSQNYKQKQLIVLILRLDKYLLILTLSWVFLVQTLNLKNLNLKLN